MWRNPFNIGTHMKDVNRCFRTLGRLFTFEITLRPKHELVTKGPYAWVRHPSYTGVYLTLLGATAVMCAPGTFFIEYGMFGVSGILVLCLWAVKCVFVFRGISIRVGVEDEMLRVAFGEAWTEYARRVPYHFLPGLV
ncbi:hypothetical protein BDZ94DRAFT_1253841 [Collybia nuda]|uniref:Protein-S-isoprenylcysteine O-methyltransferase n=1 Tax=Collybia nuda TaxID=64659 RepID=A0A9P5Y8S2_9AGAR|nr:hypothetical protein BDZ94DRAFT_1253841 [Collybia nuda]